MKWNVRPKLRGGLKGGLTQVLGLLLLVSLLGLRVWDPAVVQTVRNQSFDLYQRTFPREYTPAPVVIVDIDEASLEAVGQWPWPRTRIAQLVEAIAAAGAPAAGFDVVFAEAQRMDPASISSALPDLPL
ncbi:MAG: CHASE2 domain-containing protein, partial [Pseudomonadota bacterium]